MKRKGWFRIPGVQDGERTLEDQVTAVRAALPECSGKTVLDLGAAECLIGREFARAGATSVHCVDSIAGNIDTGKGQCAGLKMSFEVADLNVLIREQTAKKAIPQYDIVLALGVTHKLHDPAVGVRYCAAAARQLILFRSGRRAERGIITNKWNSKVSVDAWALMQELGWALEKTLTGPHPHREDVEYWRRA